MVNLLTKVAIHSRQFYFLFWKNIPIKFNAWDKMPNAICNIYNTFCVKR